MKRPSTLQTLVIAALAVLMTAAGAPAMVCVSMADCPMTEPAASACQGTMDESHCAPARIETDDDCCGVTEAPPPRVISPEVATVVSPETAAAAPSLENLVPHPFRTRPFDATESSRRPAGRSLLSLHQTLLN